MNDKTIYELDLHETLDCNRHLVRRVPGGWLYISSADTTFVPFHDEFQPNRGQYVMPDSSTMAIDRDAKTRIEYDIFEKMEGDIETLRYENEQLKGLNIEFKRHIKNLNYQLEQAGK